MLTPLTCVNATRPELCDTPTMSASQPAPPPLPVPLCAAVCDVDGVLVDSPHERAWREALAGFAPSALFTTAFYQAEVAGKPRLDGARAALAGLGVAGAERLAPDYAARKQARVLELIEAGAYAVFPDALRLVQAMRALHWRCAAASSSQNARRMLANIPAGRGSALELFDADVCGRSVPRGKPAPDLFLLAAAELGVAPAQCVVIEDAPAGIAAAKAGGMTALGIARHGDAALLHAAGAELVVASLDAVCTQALATGALRARPEET